MVLFRPNFVDAKQLATNGDTPQHFCTSTQHRCFRYLFCCAQDEEDEEETEKAAEAEKLKRQKRDDAISKEEEEGERGVVSTQATLIAFRRPGVCLADRPLADCWWQEIFRIAFLPKSLRDLSGRLLVCCNLASS